jgi:hypothetical protein
MVMKNKCCAALVRAAPLCAYTPAGLRRGCHTEPVEVPVSGSYRVYDGEGGMSIAQPFTASLAWQSLIEGREVFI